MTRSLLFLGLVTVASTAALAAGPDPRLAGYQVAPGYKVEIAATEPLVINPVTMTFGLDGRLYVVEWFEGRGPNDRIKVLTDTDGDGAFDRADIYMDGLDLPAGLLFWDGWTYVALDHDLVRFRDQDGDGKFEERQTVLTGFGNDNSHHRLSGIAIGPDGWLYLTTGDSDAHARGPDGSEATVLRSGGVFRCKPDGSKLEVFAFGMRNPWGNVAFDDEFHVFHTDNDNEGSPAFTGCRLLHVVEGGDYGWRLREGARCCQPDPERATWNGGRPGRLGSMAETGRGAPAGLCVLNSAAFPPSARNLLIYPDVFRKSVRAYKLKPSDATYTLAEEFELLASNDPLFRPDDAEIGPDGALYVLDWRTDSGGAGQLNGNGKTGRIYRVTWGGTATEPARPVLPRDRFVEVLKKDDRGLLQALGSDDYGMRRVASLETIRRHSIGPDALARFITAQDTPEPARRHALALLSVLAPDPARQVWPSVHGPVLTRLAFEFAGRFASPDDSELMLNLLSGPGMIFGAGEDPQVNRACSFALGRFNQITKPVALHIENGYFRFDVQYAVNWLQKLGETHLAATTARGRKPDAWLLDARTRGLERLGQPALAELVRAVRGGDPRASQAALYALQGWRGREGAAAVLTEATTEDNLATPARVGLFRALRVLGEAVPPDPIANWLANRPNADPPARAEATRDLAAMGTRAVLASGRVLPALLADPNGEVRLAALELAKVARSGEARAALIELIQRADRSVEERRQGIADLRGYEDRSSAPMLAGLFLGAKDAGLKNEALRALAALDFEAAAKLARSALDDQDNALRQEAIALLGQRPGTALEVVRRYNAGQLPAEDLARVIEAVRPHATPELQAAMQTLLKDRLLAAPTGEEARKLREAVRQHGDPMRGKAIFLDTAKGNCASCHRLEGVGTAVGPDLTRVWETLSFEKRVESILEPSKEIKEGYVTSRVATVDGRILTGLLLSDTPEAVTLRDAQAREVRIPSKEVEQKGTDPVSLMPAGLVGHLSFADLADLLAFLGDRKAQEGLKKP